MELLLLFFAIITPTWKTPFRGRVISLRSAMQNMTQTDNIRSHGRCMKFYAAWPYQIIRFIHILIILIRLAAYPGLILGMHPANERRRYKVTPSLIGWAKT